MSSSNDESRAHTESGESSDNQNSDVDIEARSQEAGAFTLPPSVNRVSLLENMPTEVRYILYQCLLPSHQRVDLTKSFHNPTLQGPILYALSQTYPWLKEDISSWFSDTIRRRYTKTDLWGYLDLETVSFVLDFTPDFRNHYNTCFPRQCPRCWSFQRNFDLTDHYAVFITHLSIHYRDVRCIPLPGFDYNRLPNLKSVDVMIGEAEEGWEMSRMAIDQTRSVQTLDGSTCHVYTARSRVETIFRDIRLQGSDDKDIMVRVRCLPFPRTLLVRIRNQWSDLVQSQVYMRHVLSNYIHLN
jgi:hypothetical protein